MANFGIGTLEAAPSATRPAAFEERSWLSRASRRPSSARIRFPDWLGALPSEQAVIDATRVVIHTQEQAGIDLVCDGELYRFDVNHPETNGMIEYFVKPMAGVRSGVTFDELVAYRGSAGDEIPHAPAGRRRRADRAGTLDLPQACARAKRLIDGRSSSR